MARPPILIRKDVLLCMWKKSESGVPRSIILRQENLDISSPTLAKFFSYVDSLNYYKDYERIYPDVKNSLFPEWAIDSKTKIILPNILGYSYSGTMPYGKWTTE